MTKNGKKYSYIKNPFAKNGWITLLLGLASLVCTLAVIAASVLMSGAVGLFSAALGVSGILLGLCALWFTVMALREKNRNYLIALIGGAIGTISLVLWVWVLI